MYKAMMRGELTTFKEIIFKLPVKNFERRIF